MEGADELPAELVDQRVRNRIIECLELLSTPLHELRWDSDAVLNLWADWVHPPIDSNYPSPPYSDKERDAIEAINSEIENFCQLTSQAGSGNARVSDSWPSLCAAAREALAVFTVRGRFSEDRVAT